MEEGKVIVKIGNKQLAFVPEPGNDYDARFAEEVKEVAANSPKSIQDFFCQLAELQKRSKARIVNSDEKNRHGKRQ